MISLLRIATHRWSRVACSFMALAGLTIAVPADAAEDLVHVGHTTTVVKDVQGQPPGQEPARIVAAEKIYFNENVITSGGSSIIIQFRDGSTFELGPDGAMTLDDMVFNPFEGESNKIINLIQGSFRYISGYTTASAGVIINTPIATIGIRGSNDSGFYIPDGSGSGTLFNTISSGAATMSNDAGTETFESGQSSALAGAGAGIMSAEDMPASLAAEGMNFVEQSLGSSSEAVSQNLSSDQQAANAAANALPLDQQTLAQTTAAQGIDPADLPTIVAPALFQQAAAVGALSADAVNNPTPDQQAAFAAVEANNPDAAAAIESFTQSGAQANAANVDAGTQDVVTGTSANVTDVAQIAELMQVTVAANPDVTAIAAGAAISGGSQNEAVGDIADVAQQVGEGVVAGASDAGIDIAGAVQAAGSGVVAGAAASGLDVGAVTQGATEGAIAGAVAAGEDVGAVANAAAQGAIQGAVDAGVDVGTVTQAVTAGAISASVEAGIDVTAIVQSVSAGAITAAVETGADVTVVAQSVTASAIETSEALNLDTAEITAAVVDGATQAGEETGTDVGAVTDAIAETVTDTVIDEPAATDTPAPADVEPDAPETESEQQNNASPN